MISWQAPYFSTIGPAIDSLGLGRCFVRSRQRRAIQNHIGSVHAMALGDAAELAGGLATEATMPASMRRIPKDMAVRYLKMARGELRATAHVPTLVDATLGQELHAIGDARNRDDDVAFDADLTMWVSPKARTRSSSGLVLRHWRRAPALDMISASMRSTLGVSPT